MGDLNKISYLPSSKKKDNVKQINLKDSKESQESERNKKIIAKKIVGEIREKTFQATDSKDINNLACEPLESINSIKSYSKSNYGKHLEVELEDGRILKFIHGAYFLTQREGIPGDIKIPFRGMTPDEGEILMKFVDDKIENETDSREKQEFVDLKCLLKTALEDVGLHLPYFHRLNFNEILQETYENGKFFRFKYTDKLPKDAKSSADKFSLYNVNPITFREKKLKLSKTEIGKYIRQMEDSIPKMQQMQRRVVYYPCMVDMLEKMKEDFNKIK